MTPNFLLSLFSLFIIIYYYHMFAESSISLSINLETTILPKVNFESLQVSSFSTSKLTNFSLFQIVNLDNQPTLLVVSNNNTIAELDCDTMKLIRNYTYEMCPPGKEHVCEEKIIINHLSEISILDHKMFWLCYVIYKNILTSPAHTNCLVPKNNILTESLKWQKSGFTSNNPNFKTLSVKTSSHIFIGSFVDNSLRILRTKLPDISGQIDVSSDLETPIAEFYFEKNAEFLEAFQTNNEVYFVVSEPVSAKSHSITECLMSTDSRTIYVTRIIRICKKDEGGVVGHNEINFGTAAKANLICPIGVGKDQFLYARALSATWANSKLYILFKNQKNSPEGKVLCYYDNFAFIKAFNGPMRPPWIFPNSQKNDQTIKNPLLDVCKKLEKGSLTDDQRTVAASLSVNGLYRDLNIIPVTENPLINIGSRRVSMIKAFETGIDDSSTILILTDNRFLEIYSHNEYHEVCGVGSFELREDEIVHQITGSNIDSNILIFVSTNERMIKLKVNCGNFNTKASCLKDSPNICGWDKRTLTCTSLNDRVDVTNWERSLCRNQLHNSIWSASQICFINDSQISLKCVCNYCTNESQCKNKQKIKITNCSGVIETGQWSAWSSWSKCSGETKHKKRQRLCTSKIQCVGNGEEFLRCSDPINDVFHSGWTQWFSSTSANVFNSFRAKCIVNNFVSIPSIETREMFCGNSCPNNVMKWTKWSDCGASTIQYRLLNCSKLSECPTERIQIQNCESNSPSKLMNDQNGKENSYGTIHIILVILVSSIVWVFILIFISIILLRCRFKTQIIEKTPRRKSRSRRHPIYLGREFSDVSNDYLSSDLKSTYCDTEFPTFGHVDNVPSTSKNLYAPLPLISDNHSNTAPV